MGVSAVGQSGLSTRSVRSMLVVIFVLLAAVVYFYGPMVAPGMERAAADECNEYAGGNFRSYRLDWVSWPDADPHWSCWDARNPQVKAVDLGWWTNPFS